MDSIHFWRSKTRASSSPAKSKPEIPGVRFIEAYQPELFLVVGNRSHPSMNLGGTEVRFIRMFELADLLRSHFSLH
jgi:hypothetical protein